MDMDKAKRLLNIEKGINMLGGEGGWNFVCVLLGFEKSVRSKGRRIIWLELRACGPFLERPGTFSGPKSNIQIEIKRVRAQVLA